MYIHSYDTPIGIVTIEQSNSLITKVQLGKNQNQTGDTPLMRTAHMQLMQYFAGERKRFDLPISFEGSEFRRKVWTALLNIPYGEVRTYKDIAISVGNEKASRAVGGANNKNPLMILVPCHRVIGMSGKLVGYAGGLEVKQKLLDIENKNK